MNDKKAYALILGTRMVLKIHAANIGEVLNKISTAAKNQAPIHSQVVDPDTFKCVNDSLMMVFPGVGTICEVRPWDKFVDMVKAEAERKKEQTRQQQQVMGLQIPKGMLVPRR